MSWGEVKKINSDLSTPLNILNLICRIDLCGNNYEGMNDIDTTKELLNSNILYSHPVALEIVSYNFWNYVINNSTQAGKDINEAFKMNSSILPTYNTWSTLSANANAMWEIGRNVKCGVSNYYSVTYFNTILNYSGTMSGILGNSVLMDIILKDTTNPKYLPIVKIRANTVSFNEMHNSSNLVKITTVGSGNYSVPSNVNNLLVTTICGGGGGGKGSVLAGSGGGSNGGSGGGFTTLCGGGGGAGGYNIFTIKPSPSQIIPYTVGAGGIANTQGGVTSFNSVTTIRTIPSHIQDYYLPTLSSGGGIGSIAPSGLTINGGNGSGSSTSRRGGNGGGGYGGGNGTEVNGWSGYGGGGYGGGGGGSCDASVGLSGFYGIGGLTYGTGGGGIGGSTSVGGVGGQGIIALYLGRSTLA